MTIADMLKLGRRWWWVFVACPLLAAGAAYLVSSLLTPIYQANLMLLINQSRVPGVINYDDILAAQQRTQTYSRLVTTRPVLEETIRKLNLSMTPEQLLKKVDVSPVRDTQLFTVAVSDPRPEQAATIANTIGQVFIDQTRDQNVAATGTSREALQKEIDAAKQQIDDLTAQIVNLRDGPDASAAAVQSQIADLETRLGQQQSSYNGLLATQQQIDLANAQANSQIRVAEPAVAPTKFVKPRIVVNTALSGVLGLLIAAGLVALAGYLDDTVKTSGDVRRLTGKAALGSIPVLVSADGVESLRAPHSAAAERYRSLRTALQFATLGQPIRSLVITSPRPGDGKTATVTNLGAVLAQAGQRVILVDADLRKPQLHTHFSGVKNRAGLTNLLLAQPGDGLAGALLQPTEIPGLRVLTTGPLPPNPADVLNMPRMREILAHLEDAADIVLVDAPPMAVSDPLIIAGLVDGVLLVMVGGRTRSGELTQVVQELMRTATPLIGAVINRVDVKGDGFYAHYASYYGAGSDWVGDGDPAASSRTDPDGRHASADRPARQVGDPGD